MHCSRGFSLIELMVAVAVVGILATFVYPSYQDHVRGSRRAAVQSVMLEMAAKQHQRLLDVRSYRAGSPADLGVSVPSNLSNFYTLAATADNTQQPPRFTITATPANGQAADKCGTLELNQADQRTAKRNNNAVSGCW